MDYDGDRNEGYDAGYDKNRSERGSSPACVMLGAAGEKETSRIYAGHIGRAIEKKIAGWDDSPSKWSPREHKPDPNNGAIEEQSPARTMGPPKKYTPGPNAGALEVIRRPKRWSHR